MTSVMLDEHTIDELQAQAAASGMTVDAYVKVLLREGATAPSRGSRGTRSNHSWTNTRLTVRRFRRIFRVPISITSTTDGLSYRSFLTVIAVRARISRLHTMEILIRRPKPPRPFSNSAERENQNESYLYPPRLFPLGCGLPERIASRKPRRRQRLLQTCRNGPGPGRRQQGDCELYGSHTLF